VTRKLRHPRDQHNRRRWESRSKSPEWAVAWLRTEPTMRGILRKEFPDCATEHEDIILTALALAQKNCSSPDRFRAYALRTAKREAVRAAVRAREHRPAWISGEQAIPVADPQAADEAQLIDAIDAAAQEESSEPNTVVVGKDHRARILRGVGNVRRLAEHWISTGDLMRETEEFVELIRFFLEIELGRVLALQFPVDFKDQVTEEVQRITSSVEPTSGHWVESYETLGVRLPVPGRRSRFMSKETDPRNAAVWFSGLREEAAHSIVSFALKLAGVSPVLMNGWEAEKRRDRKRRLEKAWADAQLAADIAELIEGPAPQPAFPSEHAFWASGAPKLAAPSGDDPASE
jgi:hypothetical protein